MKLELFNHETKKYGQVFPEILQAIWHNLKFSYTGNCWSIFSLVRAVFLFSIFRHWLLIM